MQLLYTDLPPCGNEEGQISIIDCIQKNNLKSPIELK